MEIDNEEKFDECIKEAIRIGRKWMHISNLKKGECTQEEWDLALLLFEKELLK